MARGRRGPRRALRARWRSRLCGTRCAPDPWRQQCPRALPVPAEQRAPVRRGPRLTDRGRADPDLRPGRTPAQALYRPGEQTPAPNRPAPPQPRPHRAGAPSSPAATAMWPLPVPRSCRDGRLRQQPSRPARARGLRLPQPVAWGARRLRRRRTIAGGYGNPLRVPIPAPTVPCVPGHRQDRAASPATRCRGHERTQCWTCTPRTSTSIACAATDQAIAPSPKIRWNNDQCRQRARGHGRE